MIVLDPNSDLTLALKKCLPLSEDLDQLLKFLCTQGNNEEIYKSIIANILEQELQSSSAFVVTENLGSTSKKTVDPALVHSLKTGTGKTRRSDIYIVDKEGKNLHVLEFKSDRHGNFFYSRKRESERPFPDNIRQPEYQSILDDVEVLHSQKETYSGARFWICVILYSFNCDKENFPNQYPRYRNEELRQDSRRIRPISKLNFNKDCEEKTNSFIRSLIHLIEHSPYKCFVETERIFQSEVVSGEHRGILVRSDIVLFEIIFKQ